MNLRARMTTGGIVDAYDAILVRKANVHLSTPSGERLFLGLKDVNNFDYAKYFERNSELGSALSAIGIVDASGLTEYGREVIAQYDETI